MTLITSQDLLTLSQRLKEKSEEVFDKGEMFDAVLSAAYLGFSVEVRKLVEGLTEEGEE